MRLMRRNCAQVWTLVNVVRVHSTDCISTKPKRAQNKIHRSLKDDTRSKNAFFALGPKTATFYLVFARENPTFDVSVTTNSYRSHWLTVEITVVGRKQVIVFVLAHRHVRVHVFQASCRFAYYRCVISNYAMSTRTNLKTSVKVKINAGAFISREHEQTRGIFRYGSCHSIMSLYYTYCR